MTSVLGKAESPIIQRTFQRRSNNSLAKKSLFRTSINLLCALFMYSELIYGTTIKWLNINDDVVWYIVGALACVFTLNTVSGVVCYLRCLSSGVVELNQSQKQLLGVNNNDIGFRTALPKPFTSQSDESGLVLSPSTFCPLNTSWGVSGMMMSSHSPPHTGSPGQYSPTHGSPNKSSSIHNTSGGITPSGSFLQTPGGSTGRATPSQSGLGASFMGNPSLSQSYGGASFSASFNRSLPGSTPSNSPMLGNLGDSTGLRSRFNNTSLKASPGQADGQIKDLRDLGQYLKEQDDKECRAQMASLDSSANGGQSFWNYNRGVSDYSPMLRKYTYQIACRSPQSAKAKSDENEDGSAQYEADEIWLRAGVLMDEVDLWVENLRKWLGTTIFSRLHSEIHKINKALVNIGCEDMEIGEVSISTLKQLAVTKSQYLPSLSSLIPFVEVSTNQEYVIHRILELGSSGCISDFRWHSGGEYKGKAWANHLPTDAAILIHSLCTYMDSRLPPHPKYPDGKTFTTPYFLKTPDKPNLEKNDNLCIYQTCINPPHFKVVIGDDIWNLPKGRNNLFHAILLFLHHIKTKQHGMLGKVNLGLSGINILWILDNS